MADDEEASPTAEQLKEEFGVWKDNTPVLYDLVIYHQVEWPSLTVQWLPSQPSINPHTSLALHTMILGTHTGTDDPNFLMVADVHLPPNNDSCPSVPKVELTKRFLVDGEVNRARCMPQNPNLVAAKTCGLEVYIFDIAKDVPSNEKGCNPDLRLRGHEKEGFGLSWNPSKEGYLLSGSHDCNICLWDVSSMPYSKVLDAMNVYKAHENIVEHVEWHSANENLFGSVDDDGRLMIWDLRSDMPVHSVVAHGKEANYLSFSSFNEWILATASSDATIGLFDMRKLTSPFHTLASHMEEVFQVEWDPNHETVLASSSDDRRLMVWDINRIGDEQLEGEAQDGPPELVFSHAGHIDKIEDFSWNKNEPWIISSVGSDNTIQVWKMAEDIYCDEY